MTAQAKPALEPVIKLVGNMKVQLGAEQEDGNKQKAVGEQITGLQDEIAKLEKALEEAGTQRAEEKKVFLKVSAEQNAAIAIIEKAKEVLGAAYGPKSFAQTAVQTAPQDQSVADMLGLSFVQTKQVGQNQMNELDSLLLQVGADAGLQGKQPTDRTKQGGGIMALMDEMKHDLELELAELKHEEVESIDAKLTALHGQCDFLLDNYDERKKARAQEIEGLSKSSAVLQGAKLDLHQQKTSLRGA